MIPGVKNIIAYRGTEYSLLIIAKDANDARVNITGWTAYALVRVAPQRHVVIDLAPIITNGAQGETTISFEDEDTKLWPPGEFVWDFVLERPTGERLGPFLAGTFIIKTANSRG